MVGRYMVVWLWICCDGIYDIGCVWVIVVSV